MNFKKLFIVIPTIIAQMGCYLTHLGLGQWEIQTNKQSIDVLLGQKNLKEELKNKLLLVQEIREYAHQKIGLNIKKSFRYYIDLQREQIAWNVSASEPYQLQAIMTWFPIVGSVPYIGFYSLEKAKQQADLWRKQNYDTTIRSVSGYSTLGWLEDPIFSVQLSLAEHALAEFIFHESVHATLWLENRVDLNESMAEFVGKEATKQFIIDKYGENSLQFQDIIKEQNRNKHFLALFKEYAERLDILYKNSNNHLLIEKNKIIEDFTEKWLKIVQKYYSTQTLKRLQESGKLQFNNAHFMSYLRYNSNDYDFANILASDCNGKWNCFFNEVQKKMKVK